MTVLDAVSSIGAMKDSPLADGAFNEDVDESLDCHILSKEGPCSVSGMGLAMCVCSTVGMYIGSWALSNAPPLKQCCVASGSAGGLPGGDDEDTEDVVDERMRVKS